MDSTFHVGTRGVLKILIRRTECLLAIKILIFMLLDCLMPSQLGPIYKDLNLTPTTISIYLIHDQTKYYHSQG